MQYKKKDWLKFCPQRREYSLAVKTGCILGESSLYIFQSCGHYMQLLDWLRQVCGIWYVIIHLTIC